MNGEHALSSSSSIDFNSSIPYYVQVIDRIKVMIHSRIWVPGSKIPTELELCHAYGVSRTVIRQALGELKLEGLVTARKGKGNFVTEPKINESLVWKLTGFYEDMVERGLKPLTQVLHNRVIPCSDNIAAHLNLSPGSPVIEIERVRSIQDAPIQLVTSFIPYDLCPTLATADLTNRSLYEYLEKELGLFIIRGRRAIEAVTANELEARLLCIEPGSPLVMLDSISYLDQGRPVEYYHAVHRGDRARFEVELVRAPRGEDASKTSKFIA